MGASHYDALVIGAGMSGLAAAIRLAQFEKRVLLVDRHSLWGGLNSFYKHGGRRFDTGLHALTNFAPKGARGAPLTKILRQLRLSWEELRLAEQGFSEIVTPGERLRFANDPALLESEVARAFPAQRDAFARLVRHVRECDPFDPHAPALSARAELARFVDDERLAEMLLLPLVWYGSAIEDDLEWNDFVILFRSVFLEGFARPEGGIKRLLDLLVARCRALGVEIAMNTAVEEILLGPLGAAGARGARLSDGREVLAQHVFSSAGWVETLRLAGREAPASEHGWVTLFEALWVLPRPCAALGHAATITFFNQGERVRWREPRELVDAGAGVLCASDNYRTLQPPSEGLLRVTALANHARWCALAESDYAAAKQRVAAELGAQAARLGIDPRGQALLHDSFTPRTIRHYTGHVNGAVYGSPRKHRDGSSGIENLHLIGNDQGLVGIVGALLSGITMANQHALYAEQA